MRIDRHSWLAMRMRREVTGVALVLLVVAALYWPDTTSLGRYWARQDVNAQSGVVIALLSGYLLFRARERFEQIPLEPVAWACLPLIACAISSLICWRAGIPTLQLLFLPLILWFALLCVLGRRAALLAAFPIGFLYFALPGWGLLAPALQRLTAAAVGFIGPLVALPVVMSGTTAVLPDGITFAIERACSGVDFLTVGIAVAALQGELEQARLRRRLRLIAGMIVLAIASNWARVLLIIEIGYRSRMRSALATRDHLAFGWVIFACALLLFVWLAARGGEGRVDAAEIETPDRDAGAHWRLATWRNGVAAAALLAVPALVYGRLLVVAPRAHAVTLQLPRAHAPWQGPDELVDPLWKPRFPGARSEREARYQSADGRAVEVIAIGFPNQSQGAQILDEGNSLLGNDGLSIETVSLVEGVGIPHGEVMVVDPQGRRSVIWSIIDIGGRLFGEPLSSQLWYGVRSLMGAPYSVLFALRTPCDGSCDVARAVLAAFLRANGSALFAALPDAEAQR